MATADEYRAFLYATLNAHTGLQVSDTYPNSGTSSLPGFPATKLDDAVEYAAAQVLTLIASNPNHPRRRDLVTQSVGLTNGQLLPSHIGPIGAVVIDTKPGRLDSPDAVQRERDESVALTMSGGLYGLEGDRIFFVGTECLVDYVPSTLLTDVGNVPTEYVNAVIACALAYLFPFNGGHIEAARHYADLWERAKEAILMIRALPEVTPYTPS